MEPITAIVTALAAGIAASLKDTADVAIKDAYAGVKALIKRKYAIVNLSQLEEMPDSKPRRAVVEEDLAKAGAAQDEDLLSGAQKLLELVQKHAPDAAGAIGVDLAELKAASLRIADIEATGGGVKIKGAEISGSIDIQGVRAGAGSSNVPQTW